jgi:hypothetical protein
MRNNNIIQQECLTTFVQADVPRPSKYAKGANIKKLYSLPTQCIDVFRMILTINSDYFPKQH